MITSNKGEQPPVRLKLFRFDPTMDRAPWFAEYDVPWRDGLLLLQALQYIQENLDDTLAFRDYCCGCGWCTSCLMMVNGKGMRTCSQPVKPGERLLVEPMRGFPVIKDLVVDFGVTQSTAEGRFKRYEGTVIKRGKQGSSASVPVHHQ